MAPDKLVQGLREQRLPLSFAAVGEDAPLPQGTADDIIRIIIVVVVGRAGEAPRVADRLRESPVDDGLMLGFCVVSICRRSANRERQNVGLDLSPAFRESWKPELSETRELCKAERLPRFVVGVSRIVQGKKRLPRFVVGVSRVVKGKTKCRPRFVVNVSRIVNRKSQNF
jgi:hypothetical protein